VPTFFFVLISIFILIPLLLFVLIFLLAKVARKDEKRSFKLAADGTTFFLIVSVYCLLETIFQKNFLLLILLVIILGFLAFLSMFRKMKGYIDIRRTLVGYWRFLFLSFLALYVLFMVYGIFSGALHLLIN